MTVEPGSGIRPMVQLPATMFVILPLSILGFAKAIKQLCLTWPQRTGWIAIPVALLPIAVFAIAQWWLLAILGVQYAQS